MGHARMPSQVGQIRDCWQVDGLLAADHDYGSTGHLRAVHRHGFAAGGQVEQLKLQGRQVGRLPAGVGGVAIGEDSWVPGQR